MNIYDTTLSHLDKKTKQLYLVMKQLNSIAHYPPCVDLCDAWINTDCSEGADCGNTLLTLGVWPGVETVVLIPSPVWPPAVVVVGKPTTYKHSPCNSYFNII